MRFMVIVKASKASEAGVLAGADGAAQERVMSCPGIVRVCGLACGPGEG